MKLDHHLFAGNRLGVIFRDQPTITTFTIQQQHGHLHMEWLCAGHHQALVSLPFAGHYQIFHWALIHIHTGRKGNFILRLHELDCAYLKYAGSRFGDVGFFGRFRPENIFGLGVKRKARTDTEHGELKKFHG